MKIEIEPGSNREKDPKGLETHDWGIEVCLIIVDTQDLSETSHYEACLVLNKCAVPEFPVEDPSQGGNVRIQWTWYCLANVQAAHILDLGVHHGTPFIHIRCVECIPNRPRVWRLRGRHESLSNLLECTKSKQCSCSLQMVH